MQKVVSLAWGVRRVLSGCGLIGVLFLAGCTPPAPVAARSAPLSPERELVDAAKASTESLRQLVDVEVARANLAAVPMVREGDLPEELRQPLRLEPWHGPLLPVVRAVAGHLDYTVTESGKAPPSPIIVGLTSEPRPAYLILEDLGQQAGVRAVVEVDPAARRIEVRYAAQ